MTLGPERRGGARRSAPLVLAALLLLAACTGDETPRPSPTPSPPGTGSPSPTTSPTASPASIPVASKVAYADQRAGPSQGDLFVYTVASNSRKRVATSENALYPQATFIDRDRISYVEENQARDRSSIMEVSLSTGATRRVLLSGPGRIFAHAWSPDRTSIAYWFQRPNGTSELRLYVLASKADRLVRRAGSQAGRGRSQDDEVRITWATDGGSLLAVNTLPDSGATMFVVRTNGNDVIEQRLGTFARWSRDGKRIFYRERAFLGRWYAVTVPGGVRSSLGITRGTYRAEVSPDGTSIAVDDASGIKTNPSVFVYSIASTTQRRLGAGVSPIWFSSNTVVVTNTERCTGDACDQSWRITGTVTRIFLSGGTRRLNFVTTENAAVLFA